MSDLTTKYRPKTLEDVVGQGEVVKSLARVLKLKTSRSFLFSGPSGTGKTTLARIVASQVGCLPRNLMEVDAASRTGIDDMREVVGQMMHQGLGGSPIRVAIIDECHSLSKQAWQSVLKVVEEPPAHAYWAFCTTERGKVPDTIETRCATYDLRPVKKEELFDLLKKVVKAEKFGTPDKVLDVLAFKSQGSPRRALSFLSSCHGCADRAAALELLREVGEAGDLVVKFCLALVQGAEWGRLQPILAQIKEEGTNPESVRIVAAEWLASSAVKAKTEERSAAALQCLQYFDKPLPGQAPFAALVMAAGRVSLQG